MGLTKEEAAKILDCAVDDDVDAVKKKYRKLALKLHPDRCSAPEAVAQLACYGGYAYLRQEEGEGGLSLAGANALHEAAPGEGGLDAEPSRAQELFVKVTAEAYKIKAVAFDEPKPGEDKPPGGTR